MTKHAVTNLLFSVGLFCLIIIGTNYPVYNFWYLILVFLYLSIIGLGSYFIQLDFFIYSYCSGDSAKPLISITFDDGPHPAHTNAILDILQSSKVPATFFCIGFNIPGYEDIIKKIDSDGHLIGTHSFNHLWHFPLQKKEKIAAEIKQSQDTISSIIDKKPLLFRPPFGVTDPLLAAAIKWTGVKSIGWSLRSYDTMISSPERLLRRVCKIKNGDIVLFHDAGLQTKTVLPLFIDYVRAEGFEIVPLDKLLDIQAYEN